MPSATQDARPISARASLLGRLIALLRPATRQAHDGGSRAGSGDSIPGLAPSILDHTNKMVRDGRYTFLLHRDLADTIDESYTAAAWKALETGMALVPGGVFPLTMQDGVPRYAEVQAFYLDRFDVSNEQFARFVAAGCYEDLDIWPQDIWPALTTRFLDRTKHAGPADWEHGRPPSGKADHPVVGISWYEASAYAQWVGKRLPTAAEWQKAAGFPEQLAANTQGKRYPWGDLFAEGKANLYHTGKGATVPVREYKAGATPNGIYQMAGNVWEWLDDRLETVPCAPDEEFIYEDPLRRILGGAFDTYLISEASNTFVTGQPELDRRPNIGFRCAVALDRLRPMPGVQI